MSTMVLLLGLLTVFAGVALALFAAGAVFEERRAAYRLAHIRIDAHGRIEGLVERLLHKLGW